MGIYIKGMKKPKNCHECVFGKYEVCAINISVEKKDTITHSCPLVEVSAPHGRLVDSDAVEKQIDYVANLDWNIEVGVSRGMLAALEIVEDAPTVIEADADND